MCGAVLKGRTKCLSCGHWNVGAKDDTKPKTMLLSDVAASEHLFAKTGPWDKCFGMRGENDFGIVLTGVTLIGGAKGTGKSTLVLKIAEQLSISLAGEILLIGSEESKEETALRARRIGIDCRRIRVMNEMSSLDNTFLDSLLETKVPPKAVILDSFQGVVGDSRQLSEDLSVRFKQIAVKHTLPVIMLNQLTKDASLAGPETLAHKVDTVIGLVMHNNSIRKLYPIKNRFGPTEVAVYFDMTGKGMVEHQCQEKSCDVCEISVDIDSSTVLE